MESAGLWTTFEDLTSKFDLRVNYTLPAHSRVVWLLVGTWYQDQYETIPLSPPMCWLFKINLSGLIHVPMKWCHLAHSGDSERQVGRFTLDCFLNQSPLTRCTCSLISSPHSWPGQMPGHLHTSHTREHNKSLRCQWSESMVAEVINMDFGSYNLLMALSRRQDHGQPEMLKTCGLWLPTVWVNVFRVV